MAGSVLPPYEPDPGSNGTITFYDRAGAPVTSGSIADTSSPAYALGSSPGQFGPSGPSTRATLFGYSPVAAVSPGDWHGEQLSLSTLYSQGSPMVPGKLATGLPLVGGPALAGAGPSGLFGQETRGFSGLAQNFPNTAPPGSAYAGLYQLRLKTSGNGSGTSSVYQVADIRISGDTWTQVYPFPATQGRAGLSAAPGPGAPAPVFTAARPPSTALKGTPYSYTFTAAGSPAPTFHVSSGALPDGLHLDSTTGKLSGTPSRRGTFPFAVKASSLAGQATTPNVTVTVASTVAPVFTAATPTVTATVGVTFTYTFVASGTPTPTYAVTGTSPSGVTLNATTGVLTWVPTATGTVTFTVVASNGTPPDAVAPVTITVVSPPATAPVFTQVTPPTSATKGTAYSYTFLATGFPTPTYTVSSGTPPPGLTLTATTGILAGTPTATGTFSFVVQASNSVGTVLSPTLTVTVAAASGGTTGGTSGGSTTQTSTTTTKATTVAATKLPKTGWNIFPSLALAALCYLLGVGALAFSSKESWGAWSAPGGGARGK